jgi:hypothetical protein
MRVFRLAGIALLAFCAWSSIARSQEAFSAGTWTRVTASGPPAAGHMLLLTDGSVLVINSDCSVTAKWSRLVPDHTGSYVKGRWVSTGSFITGYNPLYFASAVLPNGQVVIMGGEYDGCNSAWTTKGAMYNPKANKWTLMPAPIGWSTVGDASGVVLPNGKFMLANCCTTDEAILTKVSPVTWTATGSGKADENDEEGWTLLPDGNLLTVDAYVNAACCAMGAEIYNSATGTWSSGGSTAVNLVEPKSREVGPAVLRPDGTVFYAGATTNNAIYNTATGSWSAAPMFGSGLDIADGPAALLPDGNVLLDTSPGVYQTHSQFFEWDGSALHAVPGPPNAAGDSSYVGNMVVLPTGQILFTDFSADVEIYTPVGSPCSGCAPAITSVASTLTHGHANNVIKGTQFNGLSQGAAYGDDAQSASNYPLVRITDAKGNVIYCRTHSFSTMGVATGAKLVSAQFDVPFNIALGNGTLEVVANGIASTPVAVTIN